VTNHFLVYFIQSSVKSGGFFKQAKKTYPMFPFVEHRVKWDEYGEFIK